MKAIAAMDLNRLIGNGPRIPWHISEDFKWFKKMTMGGTLLMGRTTFDSIGKALPGRTTYVLTSDKEKMKAGLQNNMRYVCDWYLNVIEKDFFKRDDVWLCGGSKVYGQYFPMCTDVYLTIVLNEYEGNVHLPHFEHHFPNSTILRETRDFWVVHYWK
jgi:dihydrofolate reductase